MYKGLLAWGLLRKNVNRERNLVVRREGHQFLLALAVRKFLSAAHASVAGLVASAHLPLNQHLLLCYSHKQIQPSSFLSSFSYKLVFADLHAASKATLVTLAHLRPLNACLMSQGNPTFPGRNVYASSSKLPDRTAQKPGTTAPAQQYSQSTFGRKTEQSYQFGQPTVPQQQYGASTARPSMEKEPNALSELSAEQREELVEAVWATLFLHLLDIVD